MREDKANFIVWTTLRQIYKNVLNTTNERLFIVLTILLMNLFVEHYHTGFLSFSNFTLFVHKTSNIFQSVIQMIKIIIKALKYFYKFAF